MNKERRKRLSEIVDVLQSSLTGIEQELSDEQDCFDNLPEGIADSERGEKFEENIDNLEDAVSSIEDAIESIGNAIG